MIKAKFTNILIGFLSGNETSLSLYQNMLAVTLYDLAPWIMIAITLWGIVRLFSKNECSSDSEINDEQKCEQAESDSYNDAENEDENCDDESE